MEENNLDNNLHIDGTAPSAEGRVESPVNTAHFLKRIPLWKWSLLLVGGLVLFFILYGLSTGLSQASGKWLVDTALAIVLSSVMLAAYHFWLRLTERNSSPSDVAPISPSGKSFILPLLRGQGVGIVFFGVVTLLIFAFGQYSVKSIDWDAPSFLQWFFFFMVVGVGEEVLFRGILYRMIDKRWGKLWALLVSSLLFGFGHLPNEDATVWSSFAIAIEAGLLLGAAYSLSGNLWFPIGIHWTWNFMEGVFFGFDVSGSPSAYKFLIPEIGQSEIITGGGFGPEASVITVVLGLALSVLFLWMSAEGKKKEGTSPVR